MFKNVTQDKMKCKYKTKCDNKTGSETFAQR